MRPVFRCLLIFICICHFDALISLTASFLVASLPTSQASTRGAYAYPPRGEPGALPTLLLTCLLAGG
jgi:hypothetical protein